MPALRSKNKKMYLCKVPVAGMEEIAGELGVARHTIERWRMRYGMPCAIWKGPPTKPKAAVVGIPRSCSGKYTVLFHRPQVALWLRNNRMQWNQTRTAKRLMAMFIKTHLLDSRREGM